jgi:hypothetical protein
MAEIAMCLNRTCGWRKQCYRHAESGTRPSRRQLYFSFQPRPSGAPCQYFTRQADVDSLHARIFGQGRTQAELRKASRASA